MLEGRCCFGIGVLRFVADRHFRSRLGKQDVHPQQGSANRGEHCQANRMYWPVAQIAHEKEARDAPLR
jgi:hypothetical protein